MADNYVGKLLTELTEKTTATDTDLVPVAAKTGTLFRMTLAKLKEIFLGTKDISGIGDGTVKGAISELNTNMSNGFRMYNSLSALGLSNGKTINQVLYAMPKNSEFWSYVSDMIGITDIPEVQVFVHAIKCNNVQMVEAISLWGDRRYIGGYNGNGAVLGWKKYTAS